MSTQHQFKSHDSMEQYRQAQGQKIQALREHLVLEAENKVISHFTSKYGSAKLARDSKVDMALRKGPNDNPVYDGLITVHAEISAGLAAKKISTDVKVVHNTVGLQKFKFIDKMVADTKTEGELRQALPSEPQADPRDLKVDLLGFKLVDNESKVLDVYHPVYGEGVLGKLSKEEHTGSNKEPLVSVGAKGSFAKVHPKAILAGKAFEISDTDGDMVQLTVGKVSGWVPRSELILEAVSTAVAQKTSIDLGDRVEITSALGDYFGDTITASDIVNKQATIARMSSKEIVLAVDGVSEEVVLSSEQKSALKLVDQVATPKVQAKLESLLRDMVSNKFTDGSTNVRFVGKFKAPEIQGALPQVVASIDKKAAMENTEMAPQELELKFKQVSGFDKFMASQIQKIASKKRSLEEKVSSELAVALGKNYGPVRLLATSSALEYEYEKGHSGKISVFAEVMDKQGSKQINVEIPIVSDKAEMPKEADLAKLVSEAQLEKAKSQIAFDKEAQVKMDQIDAEAAFQEQRVEAALEGPKAKPMPKVEKTAGVGSMQPQEANIQPVFQINKAFLPQSLQIGAVIDLDGLRYRLISKTQGQLSKGAEDSSHWTFERLIATGDAPASYRVNNY